MSLSRIAASLRSLGAPAQRVLGASFSRTPGKKTWPTRQVAQWSRVTGVGSHQGMATRAVPAEKEEMFCFQCEQTRLRKGCTTIGVCGKTAEVAAVQDLLVHVVAGLSLYSHAAKELGAEIPSEIYDFTFSCLFSTLTNVNFDINRFPEYISQTLSYRQQLKDLYEATCKKQGVTPKDFGHFAGATWLPSSTDPDYLHSEGLKVGVKSDLEYYGPDVHGVRQMTVYGLKGMSTYARHAGLLGEWDHSIGAFTHEAFSFLVDGPEEERKDLVKNLELALRVGEFNLKGLSLLDKGHKERFGTPTPTNVRMSPIPGKAILVSGHDMHDLEMILKVTEGTGINVYTHGEMLPAHGYPKLKEFKHLAGHYGGAWQLQKYEFPAFPGPVVITTNCLVEPMNSYKDRLFTLNDCGWPGCRHLELPRDLDVIVETANQLGGYTEEDCAGKDEKELTVGFGHDAILANAGKVIDAVQSGALKRVFVIGGCDGAEHKRNYFSTLADILPPETLILTLGCAKYRFNRHEFGMLGDSGIPRLLDMGQCNDSYGAVVVAQALADAFKTDINSLPLSISLSWFEQKAVAVLLTMLHLGVKNIRVGPVLPAFLTPTVLEILVSKFNIQPVDIRHPQEDMDLMMSQK